MKHFKLTYYLFFICIAATACTADNSIIPDQANEEVRVQLTMQFAKTATRTTTDSGIAAEQNIDNVHLYVFEEKNGTSSYILKEEAKVTYISEADGSGKRTINGVLFEKYSNNIKLVALANLSNKGFNFSSLPGKGTSLSDFYNQLIYTRTTDTTTQWPLNGDDKLPMWGECQMNAPKEGFNNGSLSLTRAVAKVEVLVNDGKGIAENLDFQITSIKVCQYNDRGYCTPRNTSTPNVPATATVSATSLAYSLDEKEKYSCVDRIYIPEQKNTVDDDHKKVYLKLAAKTNVGGTIREFIIPFKKNGTGNDFDVLRNNIYEFNITKVDLDIDANITVTYTVKAWEYIQIDVPSFGGE